MSPTSSIDFSNVVKVKDENYRFCLSPDQDATWVKRLYGDSTVHGLFTLSQYPTDSTTRDEGAKRMILHDSTLSCCGKAPDLPQPRAKGSAKSCSKSASNKTEPVSAGENYMFQDLSEEDYATLSQMSSSRDWDPVRFLGLVKTIPTEENTEQSTPTTRPTRKSRRQGSRQASTMAPYPTQDPRRHSKTHSKGTDGGDTAYTGARGNTDPEWPRQQLLGALNQGGESANFVLPHRPQLDPSGYSQDDPGSCFSNNTTGLVHYGQDQGGFGSAHNSSPFTYPPASVLPDTSSHGNLMAWQPHLGDEFATAMFNSPPGDQISSPFTHSPSAQDTLDTQLLQALFGSQDSQSTRVPQAQSSIPVAPDELAGDQNQVMVRSETFDPLTIVQYNQYGQYGQFGDFNQLYQPDQTHADLANQGNAADQIDQSNQPGQIDQSGHQQGNIPWSN